MPHPTMLPGAPTRGHNARPERRRRRSAKAFPARYFRGLGAVSRCLHGSDVVAPKQGLVPSVARSESSLSPLTLSTGAAFSLKSVLYRVNPSGF